MATQEEGLLGIGSAVIDLQNRVKVLEERLALLMKWLTLAFKEAGFDFAKITQLESNRRKEMVQNLVLAEVNPDEISPEVQDEIARKILATESKQDGVVAQDDSWVKYVKHGGEV